MAMPTSGCIGLRNCITGINCSSIACAVNGSAAGSCCLSALSVTAGKSAPHAMSEFYSYSPANPLTLCSQTSSSSIGLSYCSACLCGMVSAGDCACVCLCYYVDTLEGKTSARICVLCNTSPILACTVTQGSTATNSYSFTIRHGDSVIYCVYASDLLEDSSAFAHLYNCTISGIVGSYCIGTTRQISASAGFA